MAAQGKVYFDPLLRQSVLPCFGFGGARSNQRGRSNNSNLDEKERIKKILHCQYSSVL